MDGWTDEQTDSQMDRQRLHLTEVHELKMLPFCWQCSQHARLVNTFQIQNSLLYVASSLTWFCNEKGNVHWLDHRADDHASLMCNHSNEPSHTWQTILILNYFCLMFTD